MHLYNKEDFKRRGITLCFTKSNEIKYIQFDKEFVPWLSILDVMMFNDKDTIRDMLSNYTMF